MLQYLLDIEASLINTHNIVFHDIEASLMNTHNIVFHGNILKIFVLILDIYCNVDNLHTSSVLHEKHTQWTRALEILKSKSVQSMTMTSSMSPFPKKNIYHLSRKLMTIGSPIPPFK